MSFYADDTNLIISNKSLNEIERISNKMLYLSINKWIDMASGLVFTSLEG